MRCLFFLKQMARFRNVRFFVWFISYCILYLLTSRHKCFVQCSTVDSISSSKKNSFIDFNNGSIILRYVLCSALRIDSKIGNFNKYSIINRSLSDRSAITDAQLDLQSRPAFFILLTDQNYRRKIDITLGTDGYVTITLEDGTVEKFHSDSVIWNSFKLAIDHEDLSKLFVSSFPSDLQRHAYMDKSYDIGYGLKFVDIAVDTDAPVCLSYIIDRSTRNVERPVVYCTGMALACASSRCDSDQPCLYGGQCVPRRVVGQETANATPDFMCLCASGYSGQRCETKTARRLCVTNDCMNGGSCFIQANRHRCVCPSGFRGQKCEITDSNGIKSGNCSNSACPFDSQCVDGRCECIAGYAGAPGKCRYVFTENLVDPCSQEPCRNGGRCIANATIGAVKKFWCICPRGFSGEFCEVRRIRSTEHMCANTVCGPGQRCIIGSGGVHRCVSITPILHNLPLLSDDATVNPAITSRPEPPSIFPVAPPFPPSTEKVAASQSACESDAGDGAAGRRCLNGGQCLQNSEGRFSCECTTGWTGLFCETALSNCGSSPCFNNGTCESTVCQNGSVCNTLPNGTKTDGLFCRCQLGFTGQHCETNVDDCVGVQCPSGKVCVDSVHAYECRCPPSFFGADCEFEAASSNECGNCKNGATCLRKRTDGTVRGNFTCVCRPGYTGRDCEREVDECELYSNPCLNGGTCYGGLAGFQCRCRSGFTGLRCDTRIIDLCETNPCGKSTSCAASTKDPKGYVCVDTTRTSGPTSCNENPCLNGATCIDTTGQSLALSSGNSNASADFACFCLPGFAGTYCESSNHHFDINAEATIKTENCDGQTTNPCQNGGGCQMTSGKHFCSCPPGFTGQFCEDDVDECQEGPCDKDSNGQFVCVNTIGGYRCDCVRGFAGNQCDVELVGCQSNPCKGKNKECKPTFANGEHGHHCDCAPGFYGTDCSEDSTISFNGNSLFYHLSTTSAAVGSGRSNYSIKFRLRTTLTDAVIVEGLDIAPSIVFTLAIRDGRLQLDWNSGDRERKTKSIKFRTKIDNGDWFGVDLEESMTGVRTNLFNSNGSLIESMPLAINRSMLPIFTTKFGGVSIEKRYFVGCMQDIFVNDQRLILIDGEKTHTAINVTKGCVRQPQCQTSEDEEICGGPKRGMCVDMWTTHACRCQRPYLAPDCTKALTEATFGYEGNSSYVDVILDQKDKKSVEMALDLSIMIRTKSADGLLAYLGSNLDNPNNAYRSFITLEISGGRLRTLVQLGTSKPQAFIDEGTAMTSKIRWKSVRGQMEDGEKDGSGESIGSIGDKADKSVNGQSGEAIGDQKSIIDYGIISNTSRLKLSTGAKIGIKKYRLDDGKLHIVRLLRRENEIEGYVDDARVFEGRLVSPFPYPLLIDHFYLGGIPSGGVAAVTRQKRQLDIDSLVGRSIDQSINSVVDRRIRQVDTFQITRKSFKGTMQDVRVNEAHVPLMKKQIQDLIAASSINKVFGDPVPHNNVLEGTVSDDVCVWKPCQNSGTCRVTFNDYRCSCADGWWGKNCTLEDICYHKNPCQQSFKCHSLRKSSTENGYICTQAVSLNGSSSATFYAVKGAMVEEADDDDADLDIDAIQFDIRTRSLNGVILMVADVGDGIIDSGQRRRMDSGQRRGSATTARINFGAIRRVTTSASIDRYPKIDTTTATTMTPGNGLEASLATTTSAFRGLKVKGRRTRDPVVERPKRENEQRATGADRSRASVFYPGHYFILEIANGAIDFQYSIKNLNLNLHLKNISGGLSIADGQWHNVRILLGNSEIDVEVDKRRRINAEIGTEIGMLKMLLEGNPVVHVGSAPRQFSRLVNGGGQSVKGCLQDVRFGKDGWLLFQQQTSTLQQLLAASETGLIFALNATSSIRDDGCHGDDVCHFGTKEACQNGATCEDEWNQRKCHCFVGFTGDFCEINIDDCLGNQCSNGATCIDGVANYTCLCARGYTGLHCETNIDDCSPPPCQNNGTCVDLVGGYECQCNANYTGVQCEISILVDCASNPCQHGGKCFDMELPNRQKTFNCSCPPAYFGRACEKEKNFCDGGPCLNGGSCTSHTDLLDYRCSCPSGFTGRICEENVDECLQKPCLHGVCSDGWGNFTCDCSSGWAGHLCNEDIDECENAPCNSTGKSVCVNSPGSYHCECPQFYFGDNCEVEGECLKQPCVRGNCTQISPTTPHHCECPYGFTGSTCETEINFCDSSPCSNGATCQPFTGGFHCGCIFGFTGTICETNINECDPNPCEHSGSCVDGIGQYMCNCSDTGYGGPTCHDDVDECQIGSMCVHSVGCTNMVGSYNCSCQNAYLGSKCDIRNPCLSNTTHSCQNNGRCVNARAVVDKAAGIGGVKVAYDCECTDGFHGDFCQMATLSDTAGLAGRLEYILGPAAGALGVLLIIAAVLVVVVLRNKRATHGTYSPSRQEISGARMQMGAMMKLPPEERLI